MSAEICSNYWRSEQWSELDEVTRPDERLDLHRPRKSEEWYGVEKV